MATAELYRHHPELVATLILVDTYAGWKGSLPEEEVRARVEGVRRVLATPAEEFDPTPPGLFANDPPGEFVPLLRDMAADARRESVRIEMLLMAEADQCDLLPRIAVPTLLIWGEQDVRSPLSVARQFEEAIPDTKLVVIPACGHVSNLERPEEFNAAVREFCRAHSPRASLSTRCEYRPSRRAAYDARMAYDEALADRIRELLREEPRLTEKKMFGGLAFLIAGNMAVAASGQGGILVRVDPDQSDELVATTTARPMEMRGRPMSGWLRVDTEHLRTSSELAEWVERGRVYARSLPAKS